MSRLLPPPPRPTPARREAAIAAALRRIDGAGTSAAPQAARAAKGPPLWTRINRPMAGALAAAAVAALIALPVAVSTMPDAPREDAPGTAAPPPPAMADAASVQSAQRGLLPAAPPAPDARTASSASTSDGGNTAQLSAVPNIPSPPAGPSQAPAPAQEPQPARRAPPLALADASDASAQAITVSGSRIRQPNLTSTPPVTVVAEASPSDGAGSVIVTGTRVAPGAATGRGDWNACTIQDPARDLAACRAAVDPAAPGRRGRAAANLADGLSRAWQGEHAGAVAAFSRAISLEPRSALAYLNRGLAWRAEGQLDRALADLDRSVRYGRGAARGYYHRSLLLRERGDIKRACADQDRAVRTDPRYARLFPSGARSACPQQR